MTAQQQKIITSLQQSLEAGPPPALQNLVAPIAANPAGSTSQLMQQLQQPLDAKSAPPVNNPSSNVNKPISIPNAVPSKLDQPPLPSPTGNNNKSNINLNHMNQQMGGNQMNISLPQQQQQHSLLNSGQPMNVPNPNGNGMQVPPIVSTPSLIQQQLTNNNTNPMQAKHQGYGMNTVYVDPVDISLASLEQPPMNNISQKNAPQDMNLFMDLHKQQQMLMNQLTAPHMGNGFAPDFNGGNGVNNLMSMLALPTNLDAASLFQMNKMQGGRFPEQVWNNPAMANNQMMQQISAQQQMQAQQQSQMVHPPQQAHPQQSSKPMLTPKPIEELLMHPNDKSKSHVGGPGPNFNNKYEQNLKNASSWSQLAAAGSPQNPGASISSKSKVPSDTFQEFKTKAKEQAQRQKQEQEKMKKQKEQQELKRQQESLQKHKTSEDMSNGHR